MLSELWAFGHGVVQIITLRSPRLLSFVQLHLCFLKDSDGHEEGKYFTPGEDDMNLINSRLVRNNCCLLDTARASRCNKAFFPKKNQDLVYFLVLKDSLVPILIKFISVPGPSAILIPLRNLIQGHIALCIIAQAYFLQNILKVNLVEAVRRVTIHGLHSYPPLSTYQIFSNLVFACF